MPSTRRERFSVARAACTLTFVTALAACSATGASGQGEPPGGVCDSSVAKGCDAIDGGRDASVVVEPPSSVDGGFGAPCVNVSNCAAPLFCLDGTCLD